MTLERPLTQDLAAAASAVTIAPPLASPASPEVAVAAAEAASAPTPATAEPPPAADTPMPDAPTETPLPTAAFEPWTCTACTFVHDEPEHAALHRCSLCGEPRGGGRKRERSDEGADGGGGGGGGAGGGAAALLGPPEALLKARLVDCLQRLYESFKQVRDDGTKFM